MEEPCSLPCLSIITSVSSFHILPFLLYHSYCVVPDVCCRGSILWPCLSHGWRHKKWDEMEGEPVQKIWCQFILMNIVFLQAGKLIHSSSRSTSPPDPILISPSIIYQVTTPPPPPPPRPKHLYLHCKEQPNTDCAQFMLIHLSAVLTAHILWIRLAGICAMIFQFWQTQFKQSSR